MLVIAAPHVLLGTILAWCLVPFGFGAATRPSVHWGLQQRLPNNHGLADVQGGLFEREN